MGLFDDVTGAVKATVLGGAQSSARDVLHNALGSTALGGLSGLVQQLNAGGLSDMVASWKNGQGLPVSVDQLKGALSPDHVQQIASALGMPADSALAHLAEHLPMLLGGQKQG